MGLFGNHYERAGSGIAKNAPKKKGIFRFFEIFGRKFWKLFELNLLYFLSFLPVIGAVALFFAVDSQLGTILAAACLVLFAVISTRSAQNSSMPVLSACWTACWRAASRRHFTCIPA